MRLLSIAVSWSLGFVCLLRLVVTPQYWFSRALLTLNTSLTLNNIHRAQCELLTDLGYITYMYTTEVSLTADYHE